MYFLTFEFRLLFDAINELTLIKVANEYFQKNSHFIFCNFINTCSICDRLKKIEWSWCIVPFENLYQVVFWLS